MHVYTFFRHDKRGKGTPVASPSYIEAVMLLKEWTINYRNEYDLRNYHFDHISDIDAYCEKLGIYECYGLVPRILTNAEYKKLFGKDIPKEKNVYETLDKAAEASTVEVKKKVIDKSEAKTSPIQNVALRIKDIIKKQVK